jgi:hypothetical protein
MTTAVLFLSANETVGLSEMFFHGSAYPSAAAQSPSLPGLNASVAGMGRLPAPRGHW